MSSCTLGVAEAVRAMMGTLGKSIRNWPSLLYSGLVNRRWKSAEDLSESQGGRLTESRGPTR